MMVLVDSSGIVDILTDDPAWAEWSEQRLAEFASHHEMVINDFIWAECSTAFNRIEDYRMAMSGFSFSHRPLPQEALFLAAKAFVLYRKAGGIRSSPLPDFFIGAHAAVAGMSLLTRDPRRVAKHFPTVAIIAP